MGVSHGVPHGKPLVSCPSAPTSSLSPHRAFVVQLRVETDMAAERPVAARLKALRSSRESGPVCVLGSFSSYSTRQVHGSQAWG